MAGYSGTPLPQKLGIKAGHVLCSLNAPDNWRDTLGALPADCKAIDLTKSKLPIDVCVAFATTLEQLHDHFKRVHPRLAPTGGLWIAWPKKTSGLATELNENLIRNIGLATGLVDNKVCAIDEIWSGLKLVIRKELR